MSYQPKGVPMMKQNKHPTAANSPAKPDTQKSPWNTDGAGDKLRKLIETHRKAVNSNNQAEDDTREAEATYNVLIDAERYIADYMPANIQEAAIKARFLFEFGVISNFTGNYTTEDDLDHQDYSAFAIVRDLEAMAALARNQGA
jgi:hypothetical protein